MDVEVMVREKQEEQLEQALGKNLLLQAAKILLNDLGYPKAELSILITGDEEIQQLNRDYREKDAPTDVLSFSLLEGEASDIAGETLGDIVISLDTAFRQAAERHLTAAEEIYRLLVHGLLHLLGYEHEGVAEEEAEAMFRKEDELMLRLQVPKVN